MLNTGWCYFNIYIHYSKMMMTSSYNFQMVSKSNVSMNNFSNLFLFMQSKFVTCGLMIFLCKIPNKIFLLILTRVFDFFFPLCGICLFKITLKVLNAVSFISFWICVPLSIRNNIYICGFYGKLIHIKAQYFKSFPLNLFWLIWFLDCD